MAALAGLYQTEQLRCPFCNAPAAKTGAESVICDFCLQPFTVVQARAETARLDSEVTRWLEQKLGAATAAGGLADASSRSFIFNERILPELKRDVNRALEQLNGFGRSGLVKLPVPQTLSGPAHPLIACRQQILDLRALRSRMMSDHVSTFAVDDAHRDAIRELDDRVAHLMHLSNVVDAAARGDVSGYASARRNLEALLADLRPDVPPGDARRTGFRLALRSRYALLAEFCRVCEECLGQTYVDVASITLRVRDIAAGLDRAAGDIELSGYSPLESMPAALAARDEAGVVRLFLEWLDSYRKLCPSAEVSLDTFLNASHSLAGAPPNPDVLRAATAVLAAARGHVPLGAANQREWIHEYAEQHRAKKTLGVFGTEEQIAGIDEFMLPVWIGEIRFNRSAGTLFATGSEDRVAAVVDACAPAADKVAFLAEADPAAHALATPRSTAGQPTALPQSTPESARAAFEAAALRSGTMASPVARVTGIGLASAAVIRYRAKNVERVVTVCLAGRVPLVADVVPYVRAATSALQHLSPS